MTKLPTREELAKHIYVAVRNFGGWACSEEESLAIADALCAVLLMREEPAPVEVPKCPDCGKSGPHPCFRGYLSPPAPSADDERLAATLAAVWSDGGTRKHPHPGEANQWRAVVKTARELLCPPVEPLTDAEIEEVRADWLMKPGEVDYRSCHLDLVQMAAAVQLAKIGRKAP
jgi:hypothetical protein